MDNRSSIFALAAFLAAAPLVFGIVVRGAVRRSRQEYVDSLRNFFRSPPSTPVGGDRETASQPDQVIDTTPDADRASNDDLISALEFLKFKYDPERRSFDWAAWLVAGLLLFGLLFFVLCFTLIVAGDLLCKNLVGGGLCLEAYFQANPSVSLTLLALDPRRLHLLVPRLPPGDPELRSRPRFFLRRRQQLHLRDRRDADRDRLPGQGRRPRADRDRAS